MTLSLENLTRNPIIILSSFKEYTKIPAWVVVDTLRHKETDIEKQMRNEKEWEAKTYIRCDCDLLFVRWSLTLSHCND